MLTHVVYLSYSILPYAYIDSLFSMNSYLSPCALPVFNTITELYVYLCSILFTFYCTNAHYFTFIAGMDDYSCYYCYYPNDNIDIIIQHITDHHAEKYVKIKRKILNEHNGQFRYRSIHFPMTVFALKDALNILETKPILSKMTNLITRPRSNSLPQSALRS